MLIIQPVTTNTKSCSCQLMCVWEYPIEGTEQSR